MTTEGSKFWLWFKNNRWKYYDLDKLCEDKKEEALDELLSELHKYDQNLFFEIGGEPTNKMELIITAGGNKKYFPMAEKLVREAPSLDDWNIIALKPPMGDNFITNYEGVELNPKKLWFLPLANDKSPKSIGIRVHFVDYQEHEKDKYLDVVYIVLDTILGERSVALDLDYVDVGKLPKNPEDEGLIALTELSKYLSWKKSNVYTKDE